MHEVCQCQSNGNPLLIARICRFLAPNVLLFFYWTYFSWTFYALRSRVSLWCVSTNSFYTNSLQLDYVQLIWKSTRHCLHGNCKKYARIWIDELFFFHIFLPFFGSILNFFRPIDICLSLLECLQSLQSSGRFNAFISASTSHSSSLICCVVEKKTKQNQIRIIEKSIQNTRNDE